MKLESIKLVSLFKELVSCLDSSKISIYFVHSLLHRF